MAATLSLAACADPPRAPIGYETDFEDYLKRSHAKAFAIAGATGDTGPSFGMAAAQTSVEDAIDLAIARCEEVQKRFNETLRCRLWSIGDIDVPRDDAPSSSQPPSRSIARTRARPTTISEPSPRRAPAAARPSLPLFARRQACYQVVAQRMGGRAVEGTGLENRQA